MWGPRQGLFCRHPPVPASLEELRIHLDEAISELEERERLVATFYSNQGLIFKEIYKALDLSVGRITQVLKQAVIANLG